MSVNACRFAQQTVSTMKNPAVCLSLLQGHSSLARETVCMVSWHFHKGLSPAFALVDRLSGTMIFARTVKYP